MSTFRLYDPDRRKTAQDFRFEYDKNVTEFAMRCCTGVLEEDWCNNRCHFLVAEGAEHVDDEGFFPVFGLDCDVEVICWGGDDVRNSTVETYCRECALIAHQHRVERERDEEISYHGQIESERRRMEERRGKQSTLVAFWQSLSDREFETECAHLFQRLGFQAERTPITNDGGMDILLRKDNRRGAAECKAWQRPCGVKEVRQFYGVLCAERMDFGYFISKGGFTGTARAFLRRVGVLHGWDINSLTDSAPPHQ